MPHQRSIPSDSHSRHIVTGIPVSAENPLKGVSNPLKPLACGGPSKVLRLVELYLFWDKDMQLGLQQLISGDVPDDDIRVSKHLLVRKTIKAEERTTKKTQVNG